MNVEQPDRIRGLYEYTFWDIINNYNETQKALDGDLIKVSEGRVLHDALVAEIGRHKINGTNTVATLSNIGPKLFIESCNKVLHERMGEDPLPLKDGQEPREQEDYRLCLENYKAMMTMNSGDKNVVDGNGFYPVSPYDDRFSRLDSVMANGSRLGGIRGSACENFYDCTDIHKALEIAYTSNVRMRDGQEVEWVGRDVEGTTLANAIDLTGLSMLKKYMPENTFYGVAPWVAAGFNTDKMTDEQIAANRKSVEKAAYILDGLAQMGREFEIQPDINTGQLKAHILDTKIDIRILDRPGNESYIGKVYDNGATVLYSSTLFNKNSNSKVIVEPTNKQALDLVKFSLGEPIEGKDGLETVGEYQTIDRVTRGKKTDVNAAYHVSGNKFVATVGLADGYDGKPDTRYHNRLRIVMDSSHRSAETSQMASVDDADKYLRDAVSSARENFERELGVEELIADWNEHHEDEGWEPKYSGNPDLAVIQQSYIDVLSGKKNTLLRPDVNEDEYKDMLAEAGEFETNDAASYVEYKNKMEKYAYSVDDNPEDIVRLHASDVMYDTIGDYDIDSDGKRFNPVGVAQYQDSAYNVSRNTADIVKAMRMLNIGADEVRGEGFYVDAVKHQLVKFDFASAQPMASIDNEFVKKMYDEIVTCLKTNGVSFDENDIRMDSNGIVRYTGKVATREAADNKNVIAVEGEIGQIFVPDEHGVVRTNFNADDNYAFVPGYTATIAPDKAGENKSVEERTLLRGYEQTMREGIRYQIRQDLLNAKEGVGVGSPVSVNDVYRHLYDERYDVDFVEQYLEQGMPEDFLNAIIETAGSRVRYSNSVRDGSTTHAEYMANTYDVDMANDNTGDAFVLTGGRNMARLTSEADGYFDPIATTATSTNQGCLRYLVEGSKVDADGHIIPSEDKNARCALMNHPFMANSKYDPFDRINMTISNIMQASALTDPVNIVQTQVEGWNMDDGFVVTKKFADGYKMRNRDGYMRSLVVGDKLSDGHGNKGVISLIVDPDMSDTEAEEQGLLNIVRMVRENPELDIMMPLFSGPSRFNAGTARDMMSGERHDFVDVNGDVHEDAMGQMQIIITDKSADTKTHIYDDEELAQGHGRKASAQLAWAFNSKGASAIMRECYGNNSTVISNMREMLIACGLDISETGEFRRGYQPHEGETRRVIEMPELQYKDNGVLDRKGMSAEFAQLIARTGGIMELPFELTYSTGDAMPPLNDGKTDVIYTEQEWERKGYTRKDGVYVKPTTVHRKVAVGQRQTDNITWGMPVLSSYLRSGQSFDDGTTSSHDYTHQYEGIFMDACEYRDAVEKLKDKNLSEKDRAKYEKIIEEKPARAQARYDKIARDIEARNFAGKHNIFRDGIMSRRMPNSATAIVTEDPRLKIDTVGIGRAMADAIGVKDGESILLWRDPVLRDSGVRYMKVTIDENLTGLSLNPVMDKSFDGDFDGDTYGLIALKSEAAKREAERLFSVQANLLDYGSGEAGNYGLAMQESLDIKLAEHHRPEIAERFAEMREEINGFEADAKISLISRDELAEKRERAVEDLTALYRDAFYGECGTETLSFKDVATHVESVYKSCVETGAKGNTAKVRGYMNWLGCTDGKDSGDIDFDEIVDNNVTRATRFDHQQVMDATAVKSHGTGIGGSFSQRGVAALRNKCQTAVLELTYPVTQSLLQSKHDAAEAKHKYEMLMGPVRDLWRGASVVQDEKGRWKTERDNEGNVVQADKDAWVQTFSDMYTTSTVAGGLNVDINKEWVDIVAQNLVDDDGKMLNIEDKENGFRTPMDQLSYGGTFGTLVELADKKSNLFEGKYNSQFAPYVVRNNMKVQEVKDVIAFNGLENDEEVMSHVDKMKAFVKKDSVEDGRERKLSTQKSISFNVADKAHPVVSDGEYQN